MAAHALRQSSRVRTACRWARVHVRTARRNVPFTLYAAATAALMVWTICAMFCVTD